MKKISGFTHSRYAAFSLVEMAIVLVILGLLLGGAMALIGPQRDVQKVKDTETEIQRTQDALIAFAINRPNGNLPCPDTNPATPGLEGPRVAAGVNAGKCQRLEGWVPFALIGGVGRQDAWGNRLRYRVSPTYSQVSPWPPVGSPVMKYTLGTVITNPPVLPIVFPEALYICNIPVAATPPTACTDINANVANNLVAVIVSYGKNGFGARNMESGVLQSLPTGAYELENTNGRNAADTADTVDGVNAPNNRRFIANVPNPVGSANGEFDDIVGWIPQGLFHSKMLAAGKLP